MTEPTRTALATIRGLLAPLDDNTRREVLAELLGEVALETSRLTKELGEWKTHVEQRADEVYAARRLLMATPNETLPHAIVRVLSNSRKVEE